MLSLKFLIFYGVLSGVNWYVMRTQYWAIKASKKEIMVQNDDTIMIRLLEISACVFMFMIIIELYIIL